MQGMNNNNQGKHLIKWHDYLKNRFENTLFLIEQELIGHLMSCNSMNTLIPLPGLDLMFISPLRVFTR